MNHSSQVGAERAPSSRNASAAIQTEQLTPSELASHDAVTLGDTDVHSTHKEREQDGETAEQAAEADNEEEENGDDDDGADGDDDEGYAAEYRSLLFRVADLASQETQRARKQLFTLRMARREAQLLSRMVQQQQVYLATRASQKASTAVATATANSCDRTAALAEGAAPSAEPLTSSEAVAQVIMLGDARLSCMAYRAECAQQQWGQLVEAAAQLTTFARVTRHDNAYGATLRAKADEVAARLCDEAGVDFNSVTGNSSSANTTNSTTVVDERDEGFALPPSSATDAWLKHSSSLTTIGGTLAKVHTLFRDAACRASMAIVATHLTQLGRQSQQLLGELQLLMQHEAHMEAAFQRSCPYSMEWGLYAAHAQQAHEMADIYSPVTVAEMRAMALRKLLLRRRQELQNALTVVLLHDAEHSLHSSAGVSWANKSSLTVSSPAAEVTPEKLKAASDDCARWESLRDRLWRELLFLKKCARREFGVAWMAQLEAAAVSATATDAAAASVPSDDVRRLAATLRAGCRAASRQPACKHVRQRGAGSAVGGAACSSREVVWWRGRQLWPSRPRQRRKGREDIWRSGADAGVVSLLSTVAPLSHRCAAASRACAGAAGKRADARSLAHLSTARKRKAQAAGSGRRGGGGVWQQPTRRGLVSYGGIAFASLRYKRSWRADGQQQPWIGGGSGERQWQGG